MSNQSHLRGTSTSFRDPSEPIVPVLFGFYMPFPVVKNNQKVTSFFFLSNTNNTDFDLYLSANYSIWLWNSFAVKNVRQPVEQCKLYIIQQQTLFLLFTLNLPAWLQKHVVFFMLFVDAVTINVIAIVWHLSFLILNGFLVLCIIWPLFIITTWWRALLILELKYQSSIIHVVYSSRFILQKNFITSLKCFTLFSSQYKL